ncbi:condensin complex subunit 1 [Folsomia candida]|uniref:Condensin complex subunit 1 n=1 Tax=Folsomia candida TaxID=158441 RepID=A0A226EKP3_FOLCA|nr:condensin complex subunit 1 [Folsomia candida]OXA58275.1 Condensin complex subunit 1 [Folsomia candida]
MEEELLSKFLQETGGQADYLEAIPPSQIQHGRLVAIHDRVRNEGTFLVTSHYPTLANAVAGEPTPPPDIISEAVRIIHKGLIKLKEEIGVHGVEVNKFNPEEINRLRRSLAIMIYLAHRGLCGMEAKSVQFVLGSGNVGGKGKSSKAASAFGGNDDASGINWRNLRSMIIEDLLEVLQLPVEKIWDDTGYGYSVPRMLIRTMCSNFNEACLAKENLRAGDEPYKIFAIVAKRFNKAADVYQRLFPLMKYGEDVGKLISRSVEVMANDYEIDDAVVNAFQTIMTIVESDMGESSKNAVLAEKGAAQVLGDLCELTPKDVIQKAGLYLVQLLKVDSVSIRSAAVQGTASLMRWLKSTDGGGLENTGKLRTQILDEILVKHCRDVNSLIRSKCLQILAKLIDEAILEPIEVAICMNAAIDRINDSAILSRKYSMLIVNNILAKFPGICSAEINYKKEVDYHRKRLLEIMAKTSPRKSYYTCAIVREFAEQVQVEEIPLPDIYDADVEEGMTKVRPLIAGLVKEDKYWDACLILYHCFQRYGKDVGIAEAGVASAKPELYIGFFNNVTTGSGDSVDFTSQSQRSMLECSLDLSKSMTTHEVELMENEEVINERKILQFSQGCLRMKQKLNSLVEKLTLLLQIGQPNDRTEVIGTIGELVRCGYPVNEKITGPVVQAIAMLAKDSAGALVPAFWSIFIGDQGIGNVDMVRNIFKILDSVDAATKGLLKPIIGEMYAVGSLSKPAVIILWDAFNRAYDSWSAHDAKNAIFVLGAIGKCNKDVITANLGFILKAGLGDDALKDFGLIRYTLEAILFSLKATKKGESDVQTTHRLSRNHALFDRLVEILVYGVSTKGNWETHQHFPRVAELAVQIIYKLSWDHIPFTNQILRRIPPIVFGSSNENQEFPNVEIKDTEEIYIRFMAIMTALLGTHINYCETVVIPEIKRRRALEGAISKPDLDNNVSRSRNSTLGGHTSNVNNSSRISARNNSSTMSRGGKRGRKPASSFSATRNADALSELEAVIGKSAFDGELDIIKSYIEKLLDHGAFRQLRRITLYFCQNITTIKHRKLKISIVNSFAKLMLVSAESVGKLIEPFINLWTIVDDDLVKVEMLKHLTALNVKFPNQMEPCNVIIKNGLMSGNTHIKMTCLDFMGYMALGDMVKIRDSIAEVALCLTSEKLVIRELAQDFFDVCAEKDNVISNAIPEVISQLSNRDGLSQQDFQGVMKFLLVRVKKEKQVVGLVETLMNRFKGSAQNGRLWEDNAYCLSQLPQGDKTFKIIRDNLRLYTDKLENEVVYTSFVHIIETLRRGNLKPDVKAKIEDYERELEELREKCLEKHRIAQAKNRQQGKNNNNRSKSQDASSLMEEQNAMDVSGDEQDENSADEGADTAHKDQDADPGDEGQDKGDEGEDKDDEDKDAAPDSTDEDPAEEDDDSSD